MNVYLVAPAKSPGPLKSTALAKVSPENIYLLPRDEFLVAYEGTSKQLCDHLEITGDALKEDHTAIVFLVSTYFGRASPDIWEWLKGKLQGT